MSAIFGFINFHKPVGPTSAQATAHVRRLFSPPGISKFTAGHLGTLDPAASGVLPIALGKAARLIPLIENRKKIYVCTLVLGRSTTTGDALGETTREMPVPPEFRASCASVLPRFIGEIEQIPPMFSAVHHAGKRLYDLARAGVTVERRPRKAMIYDAQLLEGEAERGTLRLRVTCGEGTYMRTLCEDIGSAMGSVAHMGSLAREASGPFLLPESRTLEEIAAAPLASLLGPECALSLPIVTLGEREAIDFCAGRPTTVRSHAVSGNVLVHNAALVLIGVGEAQGSRIAPRKVFA